MAPSTSTVNERSRSGKRIPMAARKAAAGPPQLAKTCPSRQLAPCRRGPRSATALYRRSSRRCRPEKSTDIKSALPPPASLAALETSGRMTRSGVTEGRKRAGLLNFDTVHQSEVDEMERIEKG
eukprot:scaffold1154_cov310-Pinguiococcus_pyrenoidosus.AAC.15